MRNVLAAAIVLAALAGTARAQTDCDEARFHVTRAGQDLYQLAERYFGDRGKWTVILNANSRVLGSDPNHVPHGLRLRIPCLAPEQSRPTHEPEPEPRPSRVELRLLTGGAYEPFTDQDLPERGLVTEIVENAFAEAPSPVSFAIEWDDDWSRHLDLLREKKFDMGFPWLRPNCEENPQNERCRDFHFSEPMFEMLVMMFSYAEAPVGFREDADVEGITLCRPAGYYTHDLDREGRKWLEDGVIKLVQPDTPTACFEMLARKEVDAVSVNEFLGRTVISDLGLSNCIEIEPRPVSIEGLHAIISKGHHRGTTHRYRFDEGVRRLREMAKYGEIVDRHLAEHYSAVESGRDAEDNCGDYETTPSESDKEEEFSETEPETGRGYVEADVRQVQKQEAKVFFIYSQWEFLAPDIDEEAGREGGLAERGFERASYASTGTGFLIAPDMILTNSHVAGAADRVIVANEVAGVVEAEVRDWTDRFDVGNADFAILKLDRPLQIEPVHFSNAAEDLDFVVAMGYPGKAQGSDRDYLRFMRALRAGEVPSAFPDNIKSDGRIQSRRRNTHGVEVLLHGSEISQGNSGGPLLDGCGRVVGINTLIAGGSAEGGSTAQYETAMTTREIKSYLDGQGVEVTMEDTICRN